MSSLATVSGLTVVIEGRPILTNLSFSVEKGSTTAVIGPNGSGKTTLLRALLGLVPYTGRIAWSGPHTIGYVPQRVDADRHLPVSFGNLLAAKAALLGSGRADIERAVSTVGLTAATLETPIGHLSGGQFQRGLIAFASLGAPQLLLLDEPAASIDKPGEEQIHELIHRLHQNSDVTIILVSHDLGFVYRSATTVLSLGASGISGRPPREALAREALEALYGQPTQFRAPGDDDA